MPVGSTWTNPTTLDKTTGQVLDQATYEAVLGDLNAIGGSTGHLVTSAGYPVVEASGTTPHMEQGYDGSTHVVASGGTWALTLTFARAFASKPAVMAACSTTSSGGLVSYSLTVLNTTTVTVAFRNNDSVSATLSNFCVTAVGA